MSTCNTPGDLRPSAHFTGVSAGQHQLLLAPRLACLMFPSLFYVFLLFYFFEISLTSQWVQLQSISFSLVYQEYNLYPQKRSSCEMIQVSEWEYLPCRVAAGAEYPWLTPGATMVQGWEKQQECTALLLQLFALSPVLLLGGPSTPGKRV